MARIGSLVADMRLQSAAFTRDLKRAQRDISSSTAKMRRSMQAVERSSQNVSRQFSRLRAGAGSLVGVLALDKLRTTFSGYETSLQQIVGLVGVAQSEVDSFNKSILEMGPAVGKGPGELADALFFITSAGIQGQEAVDTLTVSAKAATAGLGETKDVADAVTSAMNAYKSANLTAAQSTDVLVATVREGKLEASELAGSIGQVMSVAENAGVKFYEVGASVASLTRIGISTSEAVTSLRGVLVALAKEAETGKKVLKDYGLSYAIIRQNIKEKGLLATLTELRNVIGTNETALVKIFGRVEAVNAVLALTGANAAGVEGIFRRMADTTGALDKAFDAVAGRSGFRFNAAMASMEASAIILGDTVVPALATALEFVVRNINEISAAIASFIAFKTAAIFGGIAVATYKLAASLRAAAAAGALLSTVMKLNPIAIAFGLAAGAAVLLAGGIGKAEAAARLHVDAITAVDEALGLSGPAFQQASTSARTLAEADIAAAEARLNLIDALVASQGVGMMGNDTATSGQGQEIAALRTRIAESKTALAKLRTAAEESARAMSLIIGGGGFGGMTGVSAAATNMTSDVEKATKELRIEALQTKALAEALGRSRLEYENLQDRFELINDARRDSINLLTEEGRRWKEARGDVQMFGRELEKVDDQAKKNEDSARELGLTFSSAFEDAVVSGKKLSDVLRGLAQDVARLFLRKAVTEPGADFLSGIFKSGLGAAFDGFGGGLDSVLEVPLAIDAGSFGGARAGGGPVSANTSYMVGERGPELFTPGKSGTIIPNGGGDGGGNVFNIDARGADQAGLARLESLIMGLAGPNVVERRAVSATMRAASRGGAASKAFGR